MTNFNLAFKWDSYKHKQINSWTLLNTYSVHFIYFLWEFVSPVTAYFSLLNKNSQGEKRETLIHLKILLKKKYLKILQENLELLAWTFVLEWNTKSKYQNPLEEFTNILLCSSCDDFFRIILFSIFSQKSNSRFSC